MALVPPTYNPKALEELSNNPEQAAVVRSVMQKILESSPTVTVGKEVEVTHAEMEKPSQAVTQIVEALAAVTSAPGLPRRLRPPHQLNRTTSGTAATPAATSPALALSAMLTKSLETYQKATPADEAPKQKPMSVETQEAMKQTVELKIIENPPEKSAVQTPPAPIPWLLRSLWLLPRAAKVNIHTASSIPFSWKAVEGATGYEVTLSVVNGDQKTVVKTWNTSGLTVLLDRFDSVHAGTFVWEVTALRDRSGAAAERGPSTRVTFQITKEGQLSAPVLELPGDSSR